MQNTYGCGKVELLGAFTSNGFKEHVTPDGPHIKVLVRCSKCGDEFTREFCNLAQPHACARQIISASMSIAPGFNSVGPFRFEVMLVHPDAKMPYRKRATDAGYDVASVVDAVVPPHGTVNVPTGIRLACPPGTYFTIEGRSSMWVNGVTPYRGIIDSGYNGDLMVCLMNISDKPYPIEKGDRIAQVIAHRQYDIDFTEVDEFSPDYNIRGQEGFGSSGR